jgi:hypothetical protein
MKIPVAASVALCPLATRALFSAELMGTASGLLQTTWAAELFDPARGPFFCQIMLGRTD